MEVPVIIGAYLRIGIGTQVQVGPTIISTDGDTDGHRASHLIDQFAEQQ